MCVKVESVTSRVGGMRSVVTKIVQQLDNFGIAHKNNLQRPSAGIILAGSPGSGKSLLAKTISEEGKSEEILIKNFQIDKDKQQILVLEEIEVICNQKLGQTAHVERRLYGLLLTLLDESLNTFVIGTTNLEHNIPSQVTRAGRLDKVYNLSIQTWEQRLEVLEIMLQKIPLQGVEDRNQIIQILAQRTKGYSPADLQNLCMRTFLRSSSRSKSLEEIGLTLKGFEDELTKITPSALGEYHLKDTLVQPFKNPSGIYEAGIDPPKGVLIYGPSGVGKSALCCALANELDMNVILTESSQLRSMLVGESEKAIANIFSKARQSAPCILVFDQASIDNLAPRRGSRSSTENTSDRIVTSLLIEMDGFQAKETAAQRQTADVLVVAVTNRPETLDPAIVRPGRLDVHISIDLPDSTQRLKILKGQLAKMPVDAAVVDDSFLGFLVDRTGGWSGAQIINMCKEAALIALRQSIRAQKASITFP
ncbi:hypothetical protein H4219_000322 [Mycoemilia scoparia]|uniref:AAA+ ATPase domain-containing protein n=1 Tax=Mycoemilia scoparia TaxID=417184 RepID=A0A9W8A6A6_9FUNG|nr:hypothetical protein H4219_000322 [Mycoemilia scoparia]